MLIFAVANAAAKPVAPLTALDRLKAIPPEFWLRMGMAVVAILAIVFFLRKIAKMNKVVLVVVTGFIVTVIGFNWIYERDEPAWATPIVSFLSGYFPTKGVPPKKSAEQHANWR
jgi:apolipoprotein N-acyltransferase